MKVKITRIFPFFWIFLGIAGHVSQAATISKGEEPPFTLSPLTQLVVGQGISTVSLLSLEKQPADDPHALIQTDAHSLVVIEGRDPKMTTVWFKKTSRDKSFLSCLKDIFGVPISEKLDWPSRPQFTADIQGNWI